MMNIENSNYQNHIARDAALSHFSLMFGYKIFSLYYPLFLAANGLSLAQIGKVYFCLKLTKGGLLLSLKHIL